uniref:Transthyretin-like family protein n=1 Tax=Panagrellus redivivus TaxID=6233 RepID=A0A7E4ZRG6_PANRE
MEQKGVLLIGLLISIMALGCEASTKCVRATGVVVCPTDSHMAANVQVKLLDRDSLPWETDDLMGSAVTDSTGHYVVEGCGDDMFSWNDPDPFIEVRHRCPEPGHSVSIPFRTKEIDIEHVYLPESIIKVPTIRLDFH